MTDASLNHFERTIDLDDIVRVIRKRLRLILGVVSIMALIGAIGSFLIPPTYEAECNLRIKNPIGLSDSLLSDASHNSVNDQLMFTYAEILKGHTVIDAVMAKTRPRTLRYEKMLDRISVIPLRGTEIVKVKIRAGSAKEAVRVTNILVDTFLERLTRLAQSEQTTIGDFIGKRLVKATQGLEQAESSLENYKQEQQIIAPEDETKALIDRLSSLNQLKAENTANLAAAEAKLEAATHELSAREKDEDVPGSPLIGQYGTQLADLEVELVNLLSNFPEQNPKVAEIRAGIEKTRTDLNNEINRVISSATSPQSTIRQNLLQDKLQAEAEIVAAKAQAKTLNQFTANSEVQILKLPAKEQKLARLMRDASLAQDVYIMLAKRNEEAKISQIMQPTDVQIVDRPVLPDKPVWPDKILNIVVAAVLGLLAGTGLAFLLDYFNATINTIDDVKNYLSLTVIGSIPDFNQWLPKETGAPQKVDFIES